jgi:hypothetical protein
VEEFTQRKLSYSTDILYALSGLAGHMAAVTGAEYCSGIWKKELAEFLLWRVDYCIGDDWLMEPQPFKVPSSSFGASSLPHPKRHASYYAPSWSWASIIGPITFLKGRSKIHARFHPEDNVADGVQMRRIALLEAEEMECSPDPGYPFGPPRHAALTARSEAVSAIWVDKKKSGNSKIDRSKNGGTLVCASASASPDTMALSADFEPDLPDKDLDVSIGDTLLLLVVILIPDTVVAKEENRVISGQKGTKLEGLVLAPVSPGDENGHCGAGRAVYRRVGIFEAFSPRWREMATSRTVTII